MVLRQNECVHFIFHIICDVNAWGRWGRGSNQKMTKCGMLGRESQKTRFSEWHTFCMAPNHENFRPVKHKKRYEHLRSPVKSFDIVLHIWRYCSIKRKLKTISGMLSEFCNSPFYSFLDTVITSFPCEKNRVYIFFGKTAKKRINETWFKDFRTFGCTLSVKKSRQKVTKISATD